MLRSVIAESITPFSLGLVRIVVEYAKPPCVSDVFTEIQPVPWVPGSCAARIGVIATFVRPVDVAVWLDVNGDWQVIDASDRDVLSKFVSTDISPYVSHGLSSRWLR